MGQRLRPWTVARAVGPTRFRAWVAQEAWVSRPWPRPMAWVLGLPGLGLSGLGVLGQRKGGEKGQGGEGADLRFDEMLGNSPLFDIVRSHTHPLVLCSFW